MKTNLTSRSWVVIFVFIFLFSALPSIAQKPILGGDNPTLWGEDTAINPHEFTNRFYTNNGVNPKAIIDRLTGSDKMSVIGYSSNPDHTDVRVLATMPAYDQNGAMLLWSPLGALENYGFTDTKVGEVARATAKLFPVYVFPMPGATDIDLYSNTRQSAIIDNSWSIYASTMDKTFNPVGVREINVVFYTKKAFTDEGAKDMAYFGKKNGWAADDTPIIKSLNDIIYLQKIGLVSIDTYETFTVRGMMEAQYAICPMISDPTKGAIAKDATIWMTTKDGKPLEAEAHFWAQFNCLQVSGELCE